MTTDWTSNVLEYAPNADQVAIQGIAHHCGIALHRPETAHVSFSDPVEIDLIRESFLKHKLGQAEPDASLDEAIAAVGARMQGETVHNRVTVYYLLAEYFGKLGLFHGQGEAAPLPAPPHDHGPIVTAAEALLDTAGVAVGGMAGATTAALDAGAERVSHLGVGHGATTGGSGRSWLLLLVPLLLAALLLWLFGCQPKNQTATPPVAAATPAPEASASAPAAVAIPEGAGVTSEMVDGKPVVKVYFATAKTDVVPAFAPAAATLKDWLAAHTGSSLAVSGFADKTGNAAFNAELSKHRAQAVKAALVAAGIADTAVALEKPSEAIDAAADTAAARRVEVTVQ